MDLMIDIEALGVAPSSVILTIGAQLFEPDHHGWYVEPIFDNISQKYYRPFMNVKIDVDEQERLGRTTDKDTVDWWAKQSPEAIAEAFSEDDRISLSATLDKLTTLIQPCKRVWAKGSTYDMTIIENAYKMLGRKLPWKFWEVRDARTVYSLCPEINANVNGHVALEDCRNQVVILQECLRELGVKHLK